MKFARQANPKKSARAYGRGLRISTKSSAAVCKAVTGMRLEKGKSLLQDLLDEKRNLSGKHYTRTSREILNLIKSAESNAESQGLDPDSLHIHASAHKGFSFFRPRGWKRRREQAKVANIQIVLEAR